MNRSLAFQAASIRDCVSSARSDEIRDGLEGAIRTIEWCERNAETIKEFIRLMKESPEILQIVRTFPGSTVTVRNTAGQCDEVLSDGE